VTEACWDIISVSEDSKKKLLGIARAAVESTITGKRLPEFKVEEPELLKPASVFVTIRNPKKPVTLRGCIGNIQPTKPLYETVIEVAKAAAHDIRFLDDPIRPAELPDLVIEISVLSKFKKIKSMEEIEVGKHGIYIIQGFNAGILLPQVATEYGWDREEFLRHACYKAGLPPDAWKEEGTLVYIFSALVFHEEGGYI